MRKMSHQGDGCHNLVITCSKVKKEFLNAFYEGGNCRKGKYSPPQLLKLPMCRSFQRWVDYREERFAICFFPVNFEGRRTHVKPESTIMKAVPKNLQNLNSAPFVRWSDFNKKEGNAKANNSESLELGRWTKGNTFPLFSDILETPKVW